MEQESFESALNRVFASAVSMVTEDEEKYTDALNYLVEDSRVNDKSVKELKRLIYAKDGVVRISAAATLAKRNAAYPSDVIPVLLTVLDVYLKNRDSVDNNLYPALALSALKEYGDQILPYEKSIWPYLHIVQDTCLQKIAINTLSRIAVHSNASWTMLCLMANHENGELREHTRQLMKSDEFVKQQWN